MKVHFKCLLVIALFLPPLISAQTINWLGENGNWSDATKWDNGVPVSNDDIVIDNNAANSLVNMDVSSTVRSLTVSEGDELSVANSQTLTVNGGPVNNNGIITLAHTSTSGVTDLQIIGNVNFNGTGTLKLGNGASTVDNRNRIFGSTSAQRLTNSASHTISGSGQVGVNQMRLTNNGTITANDTNNAMVVDLAGSDNFNTGTMEAVSGATMNITGTTFNNNGLIHADNLNSTVNITSSIINNENGLIHADNANININSSTTSNGRHLVSGNGRLTLNTSTINTNSVLDIDRGNLDVNNSTIQDSITNIATDATMTLNASSINSGTINNNGNVVVSSSSVLRNGNLNNTNQVTVNNAQTLTLENGTFTNNGTILLNHTSTSGVTDLQIIGTVTLDGSGQLKLGEQTRTVDNRNRVFGSTSAQRLINNADHTIIGSGQIGVNQMRLTNFGTITANDTNNAMTIDLAGSDNFNTGTVEVVLGATMNITGSTFSNENGLIQANNAANNTSLSTLNITSSIINNRAGLIHADNNDANASSSTINIVGSTINNENGLIHADNTSISISTSTISDGRHLVSGNNGLLTLDGVTINSNAVVDINDGSLNAANSTIQDSTTNISANTTMTLSGSNINSGTVNNSGNIVISGSSALRNGNLNNANQITVNNAQTLTLDNGAFINNGTILLNHTSTSGLTDLQIIGTVTLTGNGELKLGEQTRTVDNRNRVFGSTSAQRLINDVDHTISGSGQLGVNQMRLTNAGTITANDTNNAMVVDLAGSDNFNTGTIESISSATMNITGTVINNDSGLIQARDTSTINISSSVIDNENGLIHTNNANININSSTISNGRHLVSGSNGRLTLNTATINSNATLDIDNGDLSINSSTIQDSTVNIATDATMTLNASSINSGTINNDGNIVVSASSVLRNGNLNNSNQVMVNNAQTLTLDNGTFNNNGTILLNHTSTSGVTDLQIIGTVTLTGDGELKLGEQTRTVDNRNRVFGSTSAQRLINDEDHTIIGSGQLGVNQMRLTNIGTITANDTNNAMVVDLAGSDNFNEGVIEAVSGATMNITGTVITNDSGLIRADASNINISSSTINNECGLIHADNGIVNVTSSTLTDGNYQIDGTSGRMILNTTNINGPARVVVNEGILESNSSNINGSIVEVGSQGQFTINASIIDGTNNGGKVKNDGLVEIVGSSTFRNSSLKNDAEVIVRNNVTLTLQNGVFENNNTIQLQQTSSSGNTSLQIIGTVNLTGSGKLQLGSNTTSVDDRTQVFGSTSAQRLIQGGRHTIEGGGRLGVNQLRLTNRGVITGNDTNDTMVIDLAGSDNFNSGTIRSVTNGSVLITGTNIINSEGAIKGTIAANGGTMTINSSNVSNGGKLIATQDGLLSITNSTITVDSIAMDDSRISIVNSNVSLSEGFAYATINSNNWNLNTASISLTGGENAAIGDWDNWSYIEVGGRDLDNDGDNQPSITQLIGTSAGFTNNFDMQQLTIGSNSKVFLMNMFDNQAGIEALYVDTFILSAGSTLYLNGINLYFSNFINQGGTIITDDLGVASLTNFSIPDLVLNTTADPELLEDPEVKPPANQVQNPDPETQTQIPEPATWLSMLIALCLIRFVKLHRKATD